MPMVSTNNANSPAITAQNHSGKRDSRTGFFSVMLLSAATSGRDDDS